MANPNPQHNPTDGLNVAAYVQVTGTNVTNPANGGLTVATEATPNDTRGLNGEGYGAVASTNHPVAQYALTLSLSGATYGGTSYPNTCQLTSVLKDVANTTYTSVGVAVYKSYGNPNAGTPSWYRPSPFAGYAGDVASVSSTGLVTGLARGQAVIEVQFPTFDFASSVLDAEPAQASGDPVLMIYAQILVNVVA
jgi:hypothetical protein